MTHLSDDRLASWLDGTLDPTDREAVATHLADCSRCRRDLRETRSLLGDGRARKRPGRVLVPLAAAAVVAILLLVPGSEETSGPILRDASGPAEGLVRIPVLPVEVDDQDAGAAVTLRWEPAGQRLDYRVTVTDPSGTPVWTTTTVETAASVPADVGLDGDAIYFWFVDVALPTGEIATSGIQELRIR